MSPQFNYWKTFLLQAIQFSQTVLFQTIQFNICIVFVHTLTNIQRVLFQKIQFSISTQFQCQKVVLSQTIRFSVSMQFSSIWPIDRTLSGATTLGQSGPASDGNEGVHCIPQSSSITGTLPSDYLVSYLGRSLGLVLPLCWDAVGVFYSPSRMGKDLTLNNPWRFICH